MYGDGMWMGFGGGFMWLFWILIIIAIVMLVKAGTSGSNQSSNPPNETPMEILKKRYARGEIDDVEYQRRKKELES